MDGGLEMEVPHIAGAHLTDKAEVDAGLCSELKARISTSSPPICLRMYRPSKIENGPRGR